MCADRNSQEIKEAVQEAYGNVARRFVETPTQSASCCGPAAETETPRQSSCCGPSAEEAPSQSSCCGSSSEVELTTAAARFYSLDEIGDLPDSVTDASLGCGNPTAIAELQPGEVVLDLGSGGGIDCFIAARKVGPEGKAIGLDMTPDMITLARRNARKVGATNVDFRYGEMEDMPLPDESVDVIISNCVINLSPDKDAVFREAYRVLRPGGRMSISDIVVDGDLPQRIRDQLSAWAGCIAGALEESVYLDKIKAAGFERVEVESRVTQASEQADSGDERKLAIVTPEGTFEGADAQGLLDEAGIDISPQELGQKIASIRVKAYKPA